MKRTLPALLSVVLCATFLPAQAAPITYDLSFISSPANPSNTLSGTITTDGTIGAIMAADILGWSFIVSGPNGGSLASSNSLGSFQCFGTAGCFTATATTLSFMFESTVGNDPFANFYNPGAQVQFAPSFQIDRFYPVVAVTSLTPTNYGVLGDIIGTAESSSAVPEPSTVALLGIGLAAIGIRRRQLVKRGRG